MAISKIISGGQTGADQGGLAAAKELGLETGGWAPRGWRTESGPCPDLASLGLKEFPSWQYPPRTKQNVRESDGTVIFADRLDSGSGLTANLCIAEEKPWIHIQLYTEDDCKRFRSFIEEFDVKTLNVAGNRESKHLGIHDWVRDFLIRALAKRSARA